jgi:sugar phosphate isomerase/epimerase
MRTQRSDCAHAPRPLRPRLDRDPGEAQTIQSQLAELRRYAGAHGLTLAREFVDDGYSGTVLERPGLNALRSCVAAAPRCSPTATAPRGSGARCLP